MQDEYRPLQHQHNAGRAELVRLLDHAHDAAKLTKGERTKIADLIGFPRQQAAEEKKQAEAQSTTKAVRTLYLDLVKHLHSDREPDEAEKARKTELLQRVTTAYEAGELLTLLRLQLELQRIDQSHLENLAEDQLRYYNKLLKEQARELDEALYLEQMDLSNFTGKPYYYAPTPAAMDYDFALQKAQLEAKIMGLMADVQGMAHDPAAVKAFLKTYKIPKGRPGPLLMQL